MLPCSTKILGNRNVGEGYLRNPGGELLKNSGRKFKPRDPPLVCPVEASDPDSIERDTIRAYSPIITKSYITDLFPWSVKREGVYEVHSHYMAPYTILGRVGPEHGRVDHDHR